jgi:hypothetical protein
MTISMRQSSDGGGSGAAANTFVHLFEGRKDQTITNLLSKGFTGRGRAGAKLHRWFDKAEEVCTALVADMDGLVAATKSVDHAQWILMPFRRRDVRGEVADLKLRWAVRRARGNCYRNWEHILPGVLALPMGMRVWYEEANMRAVTLNGLWRIGRHEQDLLRRLIVLDSRSADVPT